MDKVLKDLIKTIKKEIKARLVGDKRSWSDYPGVGRITDYDVYKHMLKHTRWFDLLNPRMVCHNSISSQLHLFGVLEEPDDPNWKYPE